MALDDMTLSWLPREKLDGASAGTECESANIAQRYLSWPTDARQQRRLGDITGVTGTQGGRGYRDVADAAPWALNIKYHFSRCIMIFSSS